MALVSAYRRPATVSEALILLRRSGAVVLGGGTMVNTAPGGPVTMVDLQALGLDRIETWGGRVRAGAMVTLARLAESPDPPAALREAARRELPSTLRSQATLGGCVVSGAGDSELLATLLVHDCLVAVAGPGGTMEFTLAEFLAALPLASGRLVTGVSFGAGGLTGAARTGRTRADRPIVAAVARLAPDGERRLALAGVAATPILADPADPAAGLRPPGDFRGSPEYRRMLAAVLAARALEAVR
jgi:putative selenate reductase FAD-binding subunit